MNISKERIAELRADAMARLRTAESYAVLFCPGVTKDAWEKRVIFWNDVLSLLDSAQKPELEVRYDEEGHSNEGSAAPHPRPEPGSGNSNHRQADTNLVDRCSDEPKIPLPPDLKKFYEKRGYAEPGSEERREMVACLDRVWRQKDTSLDDRATLFAIRCLILSAPAPASVTRAELRDWARAMTDVGDY